jgi:hypothetical protein
MGSAEEIDSVLYVHLFFIELRAYTRYILAHFIGKYA